MALVRKLTQKLLLVASSASLALLGGCFGGDMAINSVVSASPEVHRDCDRLAMKVLLASYEKAGEQQGRLMVFVSNSEIPVKGSKFSSDLYDDSMHRPKQKGDLWVATSDSGGKILNYDNFYFVDDDGNPRVWRADSASTKPEKKYLPLSYFFSPSNINENTGTGFNEISKTKNSLSCRILFFGEGEVGYMGVYTISTDGKKIYWVKD